LNYNGELYFNFAGIDCRYYDLMLISDTSNSVMLEFQAGIEREIVEISDKRKGKFYLSGFEYEPLEFTLKIAHSNVNGWTETTLSNVLKWLHKDTYKPFYFSNKPHVIYYVMIVDKPMLFTNTLGGGYIEIKMRANSPYAYTPQMINNYDFSFGGANVIEIFSLSNIQQVVYPEVEIISKDIDNTISFTAISDGDRLTSITNLDNDEIIYMNGDTKELISSKEPTTYRWEDFNKNFIRLLQGLNTFNVIGACEVQIRVQYPICY
jgi:phage-related protein